SARLGRVAELKIGKFKIANPVTAFSEDKAGALADTVLAGNIGQQIASRFRVFLDYSHDRIIFEPSATFNEPFDRAQRGMALTAPITPSFVLPMCSKTRPPPKPVCKKTM